MLQHGVPAAAESEPLSLYAHLPFCEERCSFCGCMVIITKKPEVAAGYLPRLHREIAMLAERLRGRRKVVQYHWGGGTPTYITTDQMKALHEAVTRRFEIDPHAEVAVEVDPRVTTEEQIDCLRSLGFNRLSMGVQDFTPQVQEAVNRIQPEAMTCSLFSYSRAAGFESARWKPVPMRPRYTRDEAAHLLRERFASSLAHISDAEIEAGARRAERELPPVIEPVLETVLVVAR